MGENEELGDVCMDCGRELGAAEIGYPLFEGTLCADCARRRGGEYDAESETWRIAPDLRGLPKPLEEPTAPHERQ